MAKALLGYVGSIRDQRVLEELAFLRARVQILQSELDRLRAEREAADLDLRVPDRLPEEYEPALA
ncbi:hypothetical protein BH20ACT5_BH20ACT5_11190 [soil metagenome]